MPLDVWMLVLLVVLTIGSLVYVVALRKLPWCGLTSRQALSRCWSPLTCSSPCSSRSAS